MESSRSKYLLDRVLKSIREKGDREGFTYTDTRLILTFNIIRLEISSFKKLTDQSLKALNQIGGMTSYEHYKSTHPHLYDQIQDAYYGLSSFNENFSSADIGIIGFKNKLWCKYFRKSTKYLMEQLEPLHPKGSEYRKKQLKRKGLQEGEK